MMRVSAAQLDRDATQAVSYSPDGRCSVENAIDHIDLLHSSLEKQCTSRAHHSRHHARAHVGKQVLKLEYLYASGQVIYPAPQSQDMVCT